MVAMKPTSTLLRLPLSRGLLRLRGYTTAAPHPPELIHTSFPAPHTGTIELLLLARPTARNALSRSLVHSLRSHLSAFHQPHSSSPVRALVIGSDVPRVFCAGADLKERATFSPAETDSFLAELRATMALLEDLPIPTIAAVSGFALGGGLELALAADLRVVGPAAQMGLPETRLGIIPGAGGTYRLPRLVGQSRAWDMVLTGRRVGAIEAVSIGLANRIVDVDGQLENGVEEGQEGRDDEGRIEVLNGALAVAQEICEGGPIAVRSAKAAVRAAREEAENQEYENVVATEDRNEALKAFREKRKPMFSGR